MLQNVQGRIAVVAFGEESKGFVVVKEEEQTRSSCHSVLGEMTMVCGLF